MMPKRLVRLWGLAGWGCLPLIFSGPAVVSAADSSRMAQVSTVPALADLPSGRQSRQLPQFTEVEAVVRRHFDNLRDYQPGDLISQSEAAGVFRQLRLLGFHSGGFRGILAAVPRDDDFLVRQLKTARGRQFMRQVSAYPLAYDRLDRLAGIPNGRELLLDLIRSRGGYRLIEYMTTSSQGLNLGRELARVPQGVDFNKPTGKIYTELQFIAALRALYEDQAAARQPSSVATD